jgi:hypothetical protein
MTGRRCSSRRKAANAIGKTIVGSRPCQQMTTTFADRVIEFNTTLPHPRIRVAGVKTLDPYREPVVRDLASRFYRAYYDDNQPRVFVFGINPGRFGAGTTGVPFTDPVALRDYCGIENDLPRKRELSSIFIYSFIEHWGGLEEFYKQFFFAAVSPVGFVRDGLNFNYYDDPVLLKRLHPFIVESMQKQIEIGARRDVTIVLGAGRNRQFFESINREHGFFKQIFAVEHPRFIMQYRRKKLPEFLARYHDVFIRAIA